MMSDRVVAWMYRGELLHPTCGVDVLIARGIINADEAMNHGSSGNLTRLLQDNDLNPDEPTEWDSDDFPKEVLSWHLEGMDDSERMCGLCWQVIKRTGELPPVVYLEDHIEPYPEPYTEPYFYTGPYATSNEEE